MSDICKDIGNIWSRLFDHRHFLSGEINLTVQEFELKRGDTEVDYLFKVIENITDIKDTEIVRFKGAVNNILPDVNNNLEQALSVCSQISELETNQQDYFLESGRHKRKLDWESFMDYITTTYSQVNSQTEAQESELKSKYSDLAKKLYTLKI